MRAITIMLVVFVLCGCTASQVLKDLNATNDATAKLMERGTPLIKQQGKAAIAECKSNGMQTPAKFNDLSAWAEKCPGFKALWGFQKKATDLSNGIHLGAAMGAHAISVGKTKDGQAILRKIIVAAINLKELFAESGLLKKLGL
jgi:hypothetical protein